MRFGGGLAKADNYFIRLSLFTAQEFLPFSREIFERRVGDVRGSLKGEI